VTASEREGAAEGARETMRRTHAMKDEFVDFVSRLARVETPTQHPETMKEIHGIIGPELEGLGYDVRIVPGRVSGDHLYARPKGRRRGAPGQLLIGHTDTVWPLGTLERMPVRIEDGRLEGPGTLDMKGGLTMILFALRVLKALDREPAVTPVIFLNSDEEVGSPDSKAWIARLARAVERALVVEPALGPDGRLKTARKGIGRFDISVKGRAAHAGLDPGAGASAILELSYVIQELYALNDPERGTTVNVGTIDGGTRPNVVAAAARAAVDVRVTSMEIGRRVEESVRAIRPKVPGVTIDVTGGIRIPPLERTPRNRELWHVAQALGNDLGLDLQESLAGGGSDGNTTSQFTATLDGLGCVGDGAHADHEHIVIDPTLDRCALLAGLLMAPPRPRAVEPRDAETV
jgi:glutamate carboxypeptidase